MYAKLTPSIIVPQDRHIDRSQNFIRTEYPMDVPFSWNSQNNT